MLESAMEVIWDLLIFLPWWLSGWSCSTCWVAGAETALTRRGQATRPTAVLWRAQGLSGRRLFGWRRPLGWHQILLQRHQLNDMTGQAIHHGTD
jgi:hypothetical protein